MPFYPFRVFVKSSVVLLKDSLAQTDQFPLADVIDVQEFQNAFDDHKVFGGAS